MIESYSNTLFIPELDTEFIFRYKPKAISGEFRPIWRTGLLVLLLEKCCNKGQSSLTRLHVLDWATRIIENQVSLKKFIENQVSSNVLIVRFDPALNRTIDLALCDGIIRYVNKSRIELTSIGKSISNIIYDDDNLYFSEKSFINDIGKKVSEKIVKNIFDRK